MILFIFSGLEGDVNTNRLCFKSTTDYFNNNHPMQRTKNAGYFFPSATPDFFIKIHKEMD